jgi:antitoxin component YwqK of YwqJK toxin-antitoxin module
LKRNKRYHKPIYHDTSEYYNDRKLKVNRQFKDGVLIAEIEYFQNGEIKSEKNFENGKLDGFYAEYYENNDNTRIQGKYDQGIKIGNWYYWNSEGSCYRLERYDKGVLIDAQNKCD